jgi:hypothetical protein
MVTVQCFPWPVTVGYSATYLAPKFLPTMGKVSVSACNIAELTVTASCLQICLPSSHPYTLFKFCCSWLNIDTSAFHFAPCDHSLPDILLSSHTNPHCGVGNISAAFPYFYTLTSTPFLPPPSRISWFPESFLILTTCLAPTYFSYLFGFGIYFGGRHAVA